MSTIPEVITAVHCGMSVSGISVITDLGVEGKIRKVTFDEIKGIADSAAPKVSKLVKFMIEN
jgi:purine-nucleoside phosphorylase